jgi:ABC-type sugar transport system permease subunit
LRWFGVILAILLLGPIGVFFAIQALYFSKMVSSALWYGILERPDFREGTGDVRIVKITDPDWFWSNVEFYTLVSIISVSIAVAVLLPLAIYVKSHITARAPRGSSTLLDDDFR